MAPTLTFRIPRELLHLLLRQAREQDTTPSAVIRAALDAYLHREA